MNIRALRNLAAQPLAKSIACTLAAASVCIFTPASSHAASATWNGTTDFNWLTGTNWSGAASPGTNSAVYTSTDDATFGALGVSGTINLGDIINIRSLIFGEGPDIASFTVGDANDSLYLTSGGGVTVNAGVTTNQTIGTVGTTINLSNAAAATTTFTNNGTGLLTFAGNIVSNVASGNGVLNVDGTGNTTISGTISKPGAGSLALFKKGAGTLTLSANSTWSGTGAVQTAFSGPFTVQQGTLLLNGGTHTVTGEAVIGGIVSQGGAGQNAKIQIDAGALNVSGFLSVGRGNGTGTASSDLVANNAATITAGNLSAGFNGGTGTNLPKGVITMNNTSSFTISGNGVYNLAESTGSNMTMTLNGSSQLSVAGTGAHRVGGGGTGVLTLNDTASANFGLTSGANNLGIDVGYVAGSGTINVNGGTLTTAGLNIARSTAAANTANGTVNVAGGTLTSSQDVIVGMGGTGTGKLVLDSGTVNVATNATKWLMLGKFDTGKGQIDVNGGNLKVNMGSSIKFSAGNTGTATTNVFNHNGGNVTFYSDNGVTVGGAGDLNLQQSGAATVNNTYNLNGGTLIVPQIGSTLTTGTRTFNFNGGTLTAAVSGGNLMTATAATRANVRNGGAIVNTNGLSTTILQTLLHSNVGGDNAIDGGLTKQGNGVLTLNNGTNTFTGPTLVTGGSLLLAGATAINTGSSITINGNGAKLVQTSSTAVSLPITVTQGTLDGTTTVGAVTVGAGTGGIVANGNGTTSKFTLGSLTFSGAGAMSLNVAGGATLTEGLGVTGALTSSGSPVTVNVTPVSAWVNGNTYNLVSYGSLSGAFTDYTKGTISLLGPRQTATLNNDSVGKFITMSITGDSLKWTGGDNSSWVVGTTGANSNWQLITAGSPTDYISGDGVLFDDSATGTTAVTINAANVSPTSVTFTNSALDYSVSGSFGIAGAGNLIKNGTKDVMINTANSYTGTTTVNGGTLTATNAASLGSTSAITVATGAALKIQSASDSSIPVVISGGGDLSKSGAGTWTLGNANTYTGTTTISGGTLIAGGNASFGGNAAPVLLDGGTVRASAGFTNTHPFTIGAGGGTIHVATAQYYFTTANTLLGSGTLTLIGNGTLTGANTSGNLRIDKTNTYSGNVIVRDGGIFEYGAAGAVAGGATFSIGNEGELAVQNNTALPNAITINGGTKSTLSFENGNGGSFSGPITLNANAVIALRDWYNYGNVRNGTISSVMSGNGGISINSGNGTTGVLTLTNANTYTGTTTIGSATLQLGNGGTTGALSPSSTIVNNGTFAINRTNAVTQGDDFSPAAISGTGAMTVSGTSNVTTLSATNTFTGNTTVNSGATLVLSGNNTLSTGNLILNNGATLRLQAHGGNTSGGLSTALGNNTATGATGFQLGNNSNGAVNIQLRSDNSVGFSNTTTGNNSGNVTLNFDVNNLAAVNGSGPTGQTLTFAPAGETARNGGNGLTTFNTTINVSGGNAYALEISKIVAFGDQTTINANTANVTLGSFSSTAAAAFNVGGASNVNITGGVGPGNITLGKSGAGILTLGGTSAFVGATNVTGGVLEVSGSLTATTALNISGTGTFRLGSDNGINDVATLALTAGIFATAGFDDSLSTLAVNTGASTLDLGSGSSILHFADSSAIAWTGTLSILGWNGTPTTGGGTDQLFFGASTSSLTPTQLAAIQFINPAGFDAGTYGAEILPSGELVAVVPEPATVATMLGGLAMMLGTRRNRRRTE